MTGTIYYYLAKFFRSEIYINKKEEEVDRKGNLYVEMRFEYAASSDEAGGYPVFLQRGGQNHGGRVDIPISRSNRLSSKLKILRRNFIFFVFTNYCAFILLEAVFFLLLLLYLCLQPGQ